MRKESLRVHAVNTYPFVFEATTDDGHKVIIVCKHDELRVRIFGEEFRFTMDALQMAQVRAAGMEISDPTPPA